MPLDIRLDGLYEEALKRLQRQNGLKYPVAMVRDLIRNAAKEAGVWPSPADVESGSLSDDSTDGDTPTL